MVQPRAVNRQGSGGQELTSLTKIAADIIAVTAVVAAYVAAHPELLKDLPADTGKAGASGGSTDYLRSRATACSGCTTIFITPT